MKSLSAIIAQLEKLQSDLSMLSDSWGEPEARTIRRAAYNLSCVNVELRKVLTGKETS